VHEKQCLSFLFRHIHENVIAINILRMRIFIRRQDESWTWKILSKPVFLFDYDETK